MKIEFVDNKDKPVSKFKAGDILALKEEYNGLKTGRTNYYLLGFYIDQYYLNDIETGTFAEDYTKDCLGTIEYSKEELTDVIERCDGVIYSGDKVKLVIEKNK